jgi:uncharacterized protein (DUF983 family)
MLKTVINMLGNKCPNCNKGKIFEKGLLHFSFSFPKMHENCSNCGTKFEKEPGFFFGAMFVSYGLGVAEALITYFICMPFFEETFDLRIIPIIGVVILSLTQRERR